ncbi:hypothetical protein [Mycolicibacterium mucogenicum]|uniref:DUF3558 domain-containing protein n=1 Tax=Mycolicibacterium mucogenicum TaxID=56689 RepID=A0A4R5WI63_MYCMU|nr:hypothetical protein [Mycolicibacterium mucogenicum]TDK90136.1 hypothetical protein EUA03_11315 [Mycolicibacterium mucogenicum]
MRLPLQPALAENSIAAMILLAAVACAPDESGQPTGTIPTTTTSPIRVVGFPDLSKFIEVDQYAYFGSGQRYAGISFRTPNGMTCASNDYPERQYARIDCSGPLPGKPGQWQVVAELRSAATMKDITARAPVGTSEPTALLLPTHHVLKLAADDLACGIVDNGTPACRIGNHGFALAADEPLLF